MSEVIFYAIFIGSGLIVIIWSWRKLNNMAKKRARRSTNKDIIQAKINEIAQNHRMPIRKKRTTKVRKRIVAIVIILLILLFAWLWLGPGFRP